MNFFVKKSYKKRKMKDELHFSGKKMKFYLDKVRNERQKSLCE